MVIPMGHEGLVQPTLAQTADFLCRNKKKAKRRHVGAIDNSTEDEEEVASVSYMDVHVRNPFVPQVGMPTPLLFSFKVALTDNPNQVWCTGAGEEDHAYLGVGNPLENPSDMGGVLWPWVSISKEELQELWVL